jgi:hypothetical protein
MKKLKKVLSRFTVDKYYQMDDHQLELEATKYKIGEYAENIGNRTIIRRRKIIEQLIEKDKANNSRYAIYISILALIISFLALLFN